MRPRGWAACGYPRSVWAWLCPGAAAGVGLGVLLWLRRERGLCARLCRHYLLAPTQPLFTFVHPNTERPIDNARYGSLVFERDPAAGGAMLHGFAGYFECVLYGDVLLSIHQLNALGAPPVVATPADKAAFV